MDLARTERSTGKTRAIEPTPAATNLIARCQRLLAELTAFQDFATARKCKNVDVKHFKTAVQSEEKTLQKLLEADQTATRTIHNLRSSNLPFYEAIWAVAKNTRGLLGMQKRYYWSRSSQRTAKGKQRKKSALVDVVAEGQWIKVSTITESKLLFEKAKAGWEADEFNGSSDDDTIGRKVLAEGAEPSTNTNADSDDEDDGRIELVRVVQDLKKASLATRFNFQHPEILCVLPNLEEGSNAIVDAILGEMRSAGVKVQCGKMQIPNSRHTESANTGTNVEAPASGFERMLPLFRPCMTRTVNFDCTVLLALISDLSHGDVDKLVLPEKPHPSLTYQIEIERATPLLPGILYPGLEGAERFVTSSRSAARMWDIVRIIGTSSERERAHILFGTSSESTNADPSQSPTTDAAVLQNRLRAVSVHAVPNLPLPIFTIADGINTASSIPSRVLGRVSGQLSDINRSVFILGWTNAWTTVTSNQAAVKTIESTITEELDRAQEGGGSGNEDGFDGPILWTIDVARSLVGKESGRAQ